MGDERTLYLVDSQTGEVYSEIRSRRASSESDSEPDGWPQDDGRPEKAERFTKIMTEVWRHMYRENVFTAAEERILNRLSAWLQLNTNAIVTAGGDYMCVEQMAKQIGMDKSHMHKTVKLLVKKNALGIWKSGSMEVYYMNPFLYQCGKIEPYLFWLFDREYFKRCKDEHIQRFRAGKKLTSILRPAAGGKGDEGA